MNEKFYLTKLKSSSNWYIIYFKNGKKTTITTKTKIKSEALAFLSQFKAKLNQQKKLIPKTLQEFENEYLDHISSTHSKSYVDKSVKLSFKMFKQFLKKDILLTEISVNLVDKFFTSTYARAQYSAKLYLRTLKSAFNTALRWQLVENNPFQKIKAPKSVKSIPTYINEVDLTKICNVTKEKYLKNLFWFAFLTGARLSEILSLKWSNVNLNEKVIAITNSKTFRTKNKQDRVIPINEKLFDILLEMKRINTNENDFLFYKVKGIKLSADFVSKKFKKAVRLAKLNDKIHFHSLRHSFASLIHQKGASLSVVKDLLGHQDIKTTLIYSHLSKENLVNAVSLIGNTNKKTGNFTAEALGIDINLNMN